MNNIEESLTYTGTQINYYFICKRKLWFFSHDIEMEHESDAVLVGKLIHESSFQRERKEILIDDKISIDFIGGERTIHEVKKSNKMEKAHELQLLYYIYYLKRKGVTDLRGVINYPKLRKKVEVELTPEKERELEEVLKDIRSIINSEIPPMLESNRMCKKCSYYELCMA